MTIPHNPRPHEVTVYFADGTHEVIASGMSLRLDHGGWLVITDHITSPDGKEHFERSRAFPPTSIKSVVTLRPEGD